MNLFRTKSIEQMRETAAHSGMAKTLGAFDLILLGIGCVIGTGIFVLTGVAAAKYAGPAVTISFMISGLACALAGLAYAEFSSIVPASGSAYTYTYASLGEFIAFIVGWNLILEYTVTASAVASGWSGYVTGLLLSAGIDPGHALTHVPADGGIINIPAIFITLLLSVLLIRGTQESTKLNRILVGVKLTAIAIFLLLAIPHVDTMNWEPFMPFGVSGIFGGAAIVFFAYIGYNLGSAVVGVGAIAGITTVLLVLLYGQARSFFAMSRDGMVPARVCKIHKRYHTPYIVTVMGGIFVSIIAGFVPIGVIAEMANIGTLSAFLVAAIGVLVLRITKPDVPRTFRCPLVWLIAPLAVLTCGYLMYHLPWETWVRFIVWCTFGCLVYFGYSYQHSALAHPHDDEE